LPDLGHPAGVGSNAAALYINNAGAAVGFATVYNASGTPLGMRPVVWDSLGNVTQLGDSATSSVKDIYALAINDAGTIVGNDATFPHSHALLWNSGSTSPVALTALGTYLGVPDDTGASAINSQGIVVGFSGTTISSIPSSNHAVYWNPDGTVVDLNSLISSTSGWTLTNATSISDTGWIFGVGSFDPDGPGGQAAYNRLFIVQVPEPSSLLLISLGLICLATRKLRTVDGPSEVALLLWPKN
jgi:Protein of unknown function (DUF3466)/PEP-CTERM motif